MKFILSAGQIAIWALFFGAIGFAAGRWPLIVAVQTATQADVPSTAPTPSPEASYEERLKELYHMLNPEAELFEDGQLAPQGNEEVLPSAPPSDDLDASHYYPSDTPLPIPMPAASEVQPYAAQRA